MQNAGAAQFLELVKDARNILVLARPDAALDERATTTALHDLLNRERKAHTVIAPGFDGRLERLRSFIVSIDTSKTGLAAFAHELRDGKLYLRVTPKDGLLTKSDIEIGETEWRFDLIVRIGEPEIPEGYAEFFDATPTATLTGDASLLLATL